MSGFNKLWGDFLLNESFKDEFKYDSSLKCESKFDEYTVDYEGIEILLTEAELILLAENREKKFRQVFFDKFAALYMSDSVYAATEKDPDEKYPTEVRVNVETILDNMIEGQPTGTNNKYLNAMGKMLINSETEGANNLIDTADQIIAAVEEFDRKRQNMKRKSLTDYKTLDSLKKALFNDLKLPRIMKARAEREKDKLSPRNQRAFDPDAHSIVYEDDRYFVVRPFNVESSCYFGRKTNWCIAQSGNRYFNDYTQKEGKIFYFIRDDAANQDARFSRVAVQVGGDEGEQYIEGFWDRPDDWHDDITELMDEDTVGMPQEVYEDIIEAIVDHAYEHPPSRDDTLEKLANKISEGEFNVEFDDGHLLQFDSYHEDYDEDSYYATLNAYVTFLIRMPEFVIKSNQQSEYYDYIEENINDIFDGTDVSSEFGYYDPNDYASERGEDMEENVNMRYNGPDEILMEFQLFIEGGGYFTDAGSLETAVQDVVNYFDEDQMTSIVDEFMKFVLNNNIDIERNEGYQKVLGLIQAMEDGKEIFKNVYATYETDRIESWDGEYAKDVILDFTYIATFDVLFNETGQHGLSKTTQAKARKDFDLNILHHIKRNETPILKLFRGVIEKIQRAAYQASLRQVKIDFPNYKHPEEKKVMSTPSFSTPYITSSDRGIHIRFKSEFEVNDDDLEQVDVAYNYYKYIDDNYDEIRKYFNLAFVEYLKRSEFHKEKNTARYFEKDEEPPQALDEGRFTKKELAYLRSIIQRMK